MKALVVGGTGFLGSHLVDALLACGSEVRCLSRSGGPGLLSALALGSPRLERWQGSLAEPEVLYRALEGMDVCFHLACSSLPHSSNLNPYDDVETNVLGSLALLEAARSHGLARLIFVSSGGTVYGIPQQVPIGEAHPTQPTCSYGITKLAIEKYLSLYERLHGLRSLVLRVANPYGEGQRPEAAQGAVAVFFGKAVRGETIQIWGDGSIVRDFVYVADVVEALLAAARYEGTERVFNIGSGIGLSLNDLLALLEEVLDRPVSREYQAGRSFDVPANVLCIDRARLELDWMPSVGFREGLTRMARSLSCLSG